jgi:cytochrome c-type biogenesis protein CcmH
MALRFVSLNTGIIIAGAVALGAAILYSPEDARNSPAPAPEAAPSSEVSDAMLAIQGMDRPRPAPARKEIPSVDEMVAKLAARLEKSPDDPEGWRMLGWSYFHTGNFAGAAEAYAKAMSLSPAVASYRSAYAEALVRAANGRIAFEARASFEKALELDPKEPKARLLKGLGELQDGNKAGALETWTDLLRSAGLNDEWAPDLKARVAGLAREMQISVPPGLLQNAAAPVPAREPTAAEIAAARAMPEEERASMERSMVDRLANRLAQSPQDSEGWIRLMRSREVLGEADAAKDALSQALAAFPGEGKDRDGIMTAARELGLAQ